MSQSEIKEKFIEESYGSSAEKSLYYKEANKIKLSKKPKENTPFSRNLKHFFVSAFLPQGYPDSVSKDYLQYQIYDTLQAFCSSITGTLATHAVLKGYGVGDKTATATAATLTWMLKDGTGMVGRILFAWLKGTQLDCEPKRWRFYADILNDIAIFLDLIGPWFKNYFIVIVCLSSIARSVVGVAGGATRAALTLHQAKRDNLADVSAKDGSQETLVNLVALISSLILTPIVADNQVLVWLLFFLFTFLHLTANYYAVSVVVMETLSVERLSILLKHYYLSKQISVLTPTEVARLEPVIKGSNYYSKINIGVSLSKLGITNSETCLSAMDTSAKYFIHIDKGKIDIALRIGCSDQDLRMALTHALILDMKLFSKGSQCIGGMIVEKKDECMKSFQTEKDIDKRKYLEFEKSLNENDWNLMHHRFSVDEWRYHFHAKEE